MTQRNTVARVAWVGVMAAVCVVLGVLPAAAQEDPPCGNLAVSAMSTGDFADVPPSHPFYAAVNGLEARSRATLDDLPIPGAGLDPASGCNGVRSATDKSAKGVPGTSALGTGGGSDK